MKLSVTPTPHCYDTDCDITINYIDNCPVCGTKNAKIDKEINIHAEEEITCMNCNTTFIKTEGIWFDDAEVIIKTLP